MHGLRASLHARCGEPDRKVADGVRTLSRLFTKQRDALGANYFADPALRRSYLLYFLPVNAAKVASLLREMPALPARPLRILDVGSGPGVGALAVLDHLSQRGDAAHRGSEVIAVDRSRETTRSLHEVRDRLVAAGLATVYSPCLHERPCPALVHPDDWCHEERPWAPPPMLQAVDREVGFIKDALKFSYLLLRKDGRTIAERGPDVYRVVSEVMAMKGDRRVWLCNETGRPLVGRLDKARSDANAALERWHRGAIVRVEHIERRAGIGRIENSTRVELIRPVEG